MLELKAELREIVGKKVRRLRNAGQIPAVLYGHGIVPVSLTVDAKDFNKIFKETGESSILSVALGDKKHNVLIHDLARDPRTDHILHVDFYEVRMDEKIKTKVPLVFVGESPAVKAEGGVLIKPIHEVEVEALPQDLPKEIEIDISELKTFNDHIRIKDMKVKSGVKILVEAEEIVASVVPPRSDKEIEALEAQPIAEVGEVEVVGEKEKEKTDESLQEEKKEE